MIFKHVKITMPTQRLGEETSFRAVFPNFRDPRQYMFLLQAGREQKCGLSGRDWEGAKTGPSVGP